MMQWMGLHVIIMPEKEIPAVLRNGPRSIIVTPREAVGLASMDQTVMSAILNEREAYELARIAA